MEEKKRAIYDGKEVTEEEYWKYRMEDVIRKGCKFDDLYDLMTDLELNLEPLPEEHFVIERPVAEGLYDFITTHLNVVNEAPIIEQLMFDLEDKFDLPNDQ